MVACGLVDRRFCPERCVHGLYRQAVADNTAVSAALADSWVDHYSGRRSHRPAAFAFASDLSGTRLIVDQNRGAWNRTQTLLCFDDA